MSFFKSDMMMLNSQFFLWTKQFDGDFQKRFDFESIYLNDDIHLIYDTRIVCHF